MAASKGGELKDVTKITNGHAVIYYRTYTFYSLHDLRRVGEMHGARRVIIFCLLTAVLPTILLIIPLYLRHNVFADVVYSVAESDILEIGDGISTVFCQDHSLKMNTSFSAYQLGSKPEIGSARKHIRLKKSMRLPDDTLEYWGFFLPKGSNVNVTVCSRLKGAKILIIKDEKNLKTCGLLDRSVNHVPIGKVAQDRGQVRVTYETEAQEIRSKENSTDFVDGKTRASRSVADDLDFNDAREYEDTEGMKAFFLIEEMARNYVNKNHDKSTKLRTLEESIIGRKLRHSKARSSRKNSREKSSGLKNGLSNHLIEERIETENKIRKKRNAAARDAQKLDGKVTHGGTAYNNNNTYHDSDEDSASSFEISLLTCYDGNIIDNPRVPYSELCYNISRLLSKGVERVTASHKVEAEGYYYYIFYSDNDGAPNDIHAIFDIVKPTYQYANVSKNCVNQTECTFPVAFLSNEIVIVEVPTRDGIEHEGDDITFLISTCQPRMTIYIIFPILVLFLILGCAFL